MKIHELQGVFNFSKSVEDYPYIGEISCKIGVGELVEYNGQYYSARVLDPNHNAIGVRQVKNVNLNANAETFAEPHMTCPVCNYVDNTSFELDDSGQCGCRNCGAILSYEREVSVTYSARVVQLPVVNGKGE